MHYINTEQNVFSIQKHEDIDMHSKDYEHIPLSAWHQFLDWYHEIIYKRVLLKKTDKIDINVCINIAVQFFFSNSIF